MGARDPEAQADWHRITFQNCGLARGRDEWAVAMRVFRSRREAKSVSVSMRESDLTTTSDEQGFIFVTSGVRKVSRRLYVVSVVGLLNSAAHGPQPYFTEPPQFSWRAGEVAKPTPDHIAYLIGDVLRRSEPGKTELVQALH